MLFAKLMLPSGDPIYINLSTIVSINDMPHPTAKSCRIEFVGGTERICGFSTDEFFEAPRLDFLK
jgi:hypothetical protein